MFVVGAVGMVAPIFALFIEDYIVGGNEAVAGIAMAVYLLSRSVLQIPIAVVIDKIKGEKDDFSLMIIFSILSSIIPLLYLLINQPWQLYVIQFFLGVATAVTYPTYMAIFTRHIDKNREGTEWGIYYTLVDVSSAVLAAIGGYLAVELGFHVLITVMVGIAFIGSTLLLPINAYLKRKDQISSLV